MTSLLLWFVWVVSWVVSEIQNEFHSFWSLVFVHSRVSREIRQRDNLAHSGSFILKWNLHANKILGIAENFVCFFQFYFAVLTVNMEISYPLVPLLAVPEPAQSSA